MIHQNGGEVPYSTILNVQSVQTLNVTTVAVAAVCGLFIITIKL